MATAKGVSDNCKWACFEGLSNLSPYKQMMRVNVHHLFCEI